jgi:antitoxin HicB
MRYPVQIIKDGSCYRVECRDLPEMHTAGDDIADAIKEARDGIETTFMIYIDEHRIIPSATAKQEGEHWVYISSLSAAKALLWNEFKRQGMTKTELSKRIGIDIKGIEYLFDIMHNTKMERIDAAFTALGKRLDISCADSDACIN